MRTVLPSPAAASDAGEPILAIKGLTKRFGGTEALRGVDFTVMRGEIHALLGANGAGKSTLIKILAGVHRADGGDIRIAGQPFDPASKRNRISFVHQDLGLIETMSVGENMAMGYGYPMRWKFIDWKAVDDAARKALEFLGSPLPLDRPVSELPRAEKSIVAIARALTSHCELLVLDEPTASLPEADVGRLFASSQRLAPGQCQRHLRHPPPRRGLSHRRRRDRAPRRPDGRRLPAGCDVAPERLVNDIVGRAPAARVVPRRQKDAAAAVEVSGLRIGHVGPVSFRVDVGEIVGLAGLRGAGHEAVGRAIAGVIPRASGTIAIGGKTCEDRLAGRRDCAPASASPPASAPRKRSPATMTVKENLFLNPLNFGQPSFRLRSRARRRRKPRAILAASTCARPIPIATSTTLSGGNQQKVVLARWAGQRYRVLVLEDPTIGVDVGAKAQIYRMMAEDAAAGTATIVVSSDLDELVQICDRVLAFSRGRIVAELPRDELSVEALTQAVGGMTAVAAARGRGRRHERGERDRREGGAGRGGARIRRRSDGRPARQGDSAARPLDPRPARLRHPPRHRLLDPACRRPSPARRPSAPSSATTPRSRCSRSPRCWSSPPATTTCRSPTMSG